MNAILAAATVVRRQVNFVIQEKLKENGGIDEKAPRRINRMVL